MKQPHLSAQARRELDRRFRRGDVADLRVRPHRGWIRAIRSALAMSQDDLGARLGITRAAVAQLEKAEGAGGITIAKMSQVAAALDCSLLYALIPNSTLEDTVMRQARAMAAQRSGYVASTMALEDQPISDDQRSDHLESTAREIAASGTLWDDATSHAARNRTGMR